ncbi:hypothetical protein HBI56_026290 [Parastagonospora nodorum]|uniref:Uncharacterized protein n=1 Tax=Phaeosphaeria nodorum (strain SN15 / ATCC MYA-4574 / FGSC 10173) TaxID=321614 RepID=A0A7U2HY20_PHANO|nr:hypothetical protein HBH56_013950 [Parastagonospora nodorum]QRC94903.1 hypothetical protein JI435_026500 [Parastagonospora nodorum SN15]KAH3937271.1 hypothetical protein HBH54_020500 [Parastagonospora nodorum]KAH3953791.1 hypothetical protein HBH53_032900 [Parastagonospora nodorum]KAH3969275.1 hypothetical protein HBH51_125060 [Parastagonospora nodorum]
MLEDFHLDSDNSTPSLYFILVSCLLTVLLKGEEEGKLTWEIMFGNMPPPSILDETTTQLHENWNLQTVLRGVSKFSLRPMIGFDEVQTWLEKEKEGHHINETRYRECVKYVRMWA